jgi:hypothetical protein
MRREMSVLAFRFGIRIIYCFITAKTHASEKLWQFKYKCPIHKLQIDFLKVRCPDFLLCERYHVELLGQIGSVVVILYPY